MKKLILPVLMIIIPLLSCAATVVEPNAPRLDYSTHLLSVNTTSSYNTFQLKTAGGQLVYSALIGNAGTTKLDLSAIAPGTYSYFISGNETACGELRIAY